MISYKKFIKFLLPWVVFAFIMNMSRFFLTNVHSYLYMNWNLFLAVLPFLFIFFFEKTKKLYIKILTFLAWLFFLPNTIYIVSDLIHLREVGPTWLIWFDAMMIFSYALIGVFIASFIIIKMMKLLFKDSTLKQNIFLFLLSIVSSFGVYLGRYVRWNTWDIVISPIGLMTNVFEIIRSESSNHVFITTIIFFSLFAIVSTLSLREVFTEKKS